MLNRALLWTLFAAAITAVVLETTTLFARRAELAELESQSFALNAELTSVRQAYAKAKERSRELAAVAAPPATTPGSPTDAALEKTMRRWFQRVDDLRAALAANPRLGLPELSLVDDKRWFDLVSSPYYDGDVRGAFASLRNEAETKMAQYLSTALKEYVTTHDQTLPTTIVDLVPYLDPRVDPQWLGRYELAHTGKVTDVATEDAIHIQPVDPNSDAIVRIGIGRYGGGGSVFAKTLSQAQRDYAKEHDGNRATKAGDLAPYLKWPLDPAKVQRTLDRQSANK